MTEMPPRPTRSGPVLSVRADAAVTVEPDYVVLSAALTASRETKAAALGAAATALDSLTRALAGLGGVPLTATSELAALTWSAQSARTEVEWRHDDRKGSRERTGQIIATVAVLIAARDFALLDRLGAVLGAQEALAVHNTSWHVDADNPAWRTVRAAAIHAAIGKGRDYAVALGASIDRVEHIADAGLLGGGDDSWRHGSPLRGMAMSGGHSGGEPDTPSLDPVPQELTATIEARFVATGVTLPE